MRVFFHDLTDSLLVGLAIVLVERVGVRLRRRVEIRIVQQILDAAEDLLDRDRGLPSLLLVQDRQANGARWVDIGVEKRRDEFAYCRCQLASGEGCRGSYPQGTYTLEAW